MLQGISGATTSNLSLYSCIVITMCLLLYRKRLELPGDHTTPQKLGGVGAQSEESLRLFSFEYDS